MYSYTLETLCKGRKDHAKLTWINSEHAIQSALFKERYSSRFSQYVKTHFKPGLLTTPVKEKIS